MILMTPKRSCWLLVLPALVGLLGILSAPARAQEIRKEAADRLRVPPGFKIETVFSSDRAHGSLISLTKDNNARLLAGPGQEALHGVRQLRGPSGRPASHLSTPQLRRGSRPAAR